MNWPLFADFVQAYDADTYKLVSSYMKNHAEEFKNNDEPTHARAQAIVDAINKGEPGDGKDAELVKGILSIFGTLRMHINKGYPNVVVTCGYDPSILFRCADTQEEAKSECIHLEWRIVHNWDK